MSLAKPHEEPRLLASRVVATGTWSYANGEEWSVEVIEERWNYNRELWMAVQDAMPVSSSDPGFPYSFEWMDAPEVDDGGVCLHARMRRGEETANSVRYPPEAFRRVAETWARLEWDTADHP